MFWGADGGRFVQSVVFVSGDKIYDIKNQSLAALAADAGATVQLTGNVGNDRKTITVTKTAPAGQLTTTVRGLDWKRRRLSSETVLLLSAGHDFSEEFSSVQLQCA